MRKAFSLLRQDEVYLYAFRMYKSYKVNPKRLKAFLIIA